MFYVILLEMFKVSPAQKLDVKLMYKHKLQTADIEK